MSSFTIASQFEVVECCNCNCRFAMSQDMCERRLEDGKLFHCPNGHPQRYTKRKTQADEIERLKRRIEDERRQKEYSQKESEHFRRSRDGMKGALAKSNNKLKRVKAGVCPCCNRTFQNLARHMANQHPDS